MEFIANHCFDLIALGWVLYFFGGMIHELFIPKRKAIEVQTLLDNVVYYNKRKRG